MKLFPWLRWLIRFASWAIAIISLYLFGLSIPQVAGLVCLSIAFGLLCLAAEESAK